MFVRWILYGTIILTHLFLVYRHLDSRDWCDSASKGTYLNGINMHTLLATDVYVDTCTYVPAKTMAHSKRLRVPVNVHRHATRKTIAICQRETMAEYIHIHKILPLCWLYANLGHGTHDRTHDSSHDSSYDGSHSRHR